MMMMMMMMNDDDDDKNLRNDQTGQGLSFRLGSSTHGYLLLISNALGFAILTIRAQTSLSTLAGYGDHLK